MDTVGEPPAMVTTQTGLAQNYGTTSCSVDSASDRNDRSIEAEEPAEQARQLLEAHRTAGQKLEERMTRTEASVKIRLLLLEPVRPGRKKHVELTMDDSDLERLRRDTNQRTSVAKTLDGAIGPGCFVPGQDSFNEDEYKKSSEQWNDLEMKPL